MHNCFSHVQLCATLWTVAHQAPLSMGFSRQAYWTGLPFPAPGDLPHQGSNPQTQHLLHCWQILYCWATREAQYVHYTSIKLEETNNLFFLSVFVLFQKANLFIPKCTKRDLFDKWEFKNMVFGFTLDWQNITFLDKDGYLQISFS